MKRRTEINLLLLLVPQNNCFFLLFNADMRLSWRLVKNLRNAFLKLKTDNAECISCIPQCHVIRALLIHILRAGNSQSCPFLKRTIRQR